jgi:geranylgeranyl reductase family protein
VTGPDPNFWDAVVVGAGPGGAIAARDLARAGLRVRLIEQHVLPRYKPCGGCLSLKVDQLLDPGFHEVIERTIYGGTFTSHGLDEVTVMSDRPVAYMVMRDVFDHYLVTEATRAGAILSEGERVRDVQEHPDFVELTTDRGSYRAGFVVGADGVNGVVARRLGLVPKRRLAVCVESEVVTDEEWTSPPDTVRIEFGSIPYGYGWVFPKGDHYSIGVGGFKDKIHNPRPYYDDFLIEQDLTDSILDERRQGYVIPIFQSPRNRLQTKRVILVGDAAALVDPFLGEGIYYAIRSAQLAAEVIVDASREGRDLSSSSHYVDSLKTEVFPEFLAARKLAFFLYTFPITGYRMLKRQSGFVDLYLDVIRGESTYRELWKAAKRLGAIQLATSLWPVRARAAVKETVEQHYDRVSADYDSSVKLWRRTVVEPAWQRLGDLLEPIVPKNATVLDAGAGTGDAVELLLRRADPGVVHAVDVSKGMLRRGRKRIADPRVQWKQGDLLDLPYEDRTFDIVISTWTLETLDDPGRAVSEFLRVLKDDGRVVYAFSSVPPSAIRRKAYARLIEEWSRGTLAARFLRADDRPYHDCGSSRIFSLAGGLATIVVLAKCCDVDVDDGACLPVADSGESESRQRIAQLNGR